jgi:glycosyltransferase involved in cell wall biosynthesis
MKCDGCPVRPGLTCIGEGHRPVCRDIADGLAGRAEQLITLSEGLPLPNAAEPPLGPSPDGRVRVGMLCPCLNMGGAEAWQLALARLTDSARIAWVGCCVVNGDQHVDPAMRAKTQAFMPVTAGFSAAHRLVRRCDAIVSWAIDGLANLKIGVASPPTIVNVSHSPKESPWGVGHNAATTGVDHWVAVSELALAAIPAPERASATVIWNAVDTARLAVNRPRAAMRKLWGIPEGALVAGYLGRLSEEKDPHAMRRLIECLPDGSDGDPPWHAVVVGSGAEVLEGHPRLHVVGNDPAAGDVLGGFDELIMPSKYESFGLTLVEGLHLGVPTISTPVGVAKLAPGLTRPIPVGADGPTLARAVLDDRADMRGTAARVGRGMMFARERCSEGRFGGEWTGLLVELGEKAARARPAVTRSAAQVGGGIDPAVRDAVLACKERGPEGGLTLMDDERSCCGGGEERTSCSAMKGRKPGRVTLRECLRCQSDQLTGVPS